MVKRFHHRRLSILKTVLLLGLGLALACQDAKIQTASTLTDYLIAYNVAIDSQSNDYEIFTVDPINLSRRNITSNPDVAWTYLSIDDQIMLVSDRDSCDRCFYLYQMDRDGGNISRITDFRLRDSWMSSRKDGTELIVNPNAKVDSAFYIIDRNGHILKKIYTGLPYANDPVFSPDGRFIAFRGAHKKSKREHDFMDEIYLIQDDGANLQQLTHYPPGDTTAAWYAYKAGPPRWHPTDNFISYQSFREGKYSLFGITPDGQKQWKLTQNTEQEGYHSWSPDGKWLALEVFDSAETQFHVAVMDWVTRQMKVLTDTSYVYQQGPVFVRR